MKYRGIQFEPRKLVPAFRKMIFKDRFETHHFKNFVKKIFTFEDLRRKWGEYV